MTHTLGSDEDLAQAKCERAAHREALTYHAVCLPLEDLAGEGAGFCRQPATQSSSGVAIMYYPLSSLARRLDGSD